MKYLLTDYFLMNCILSFIKNITPSYLIQPFEKTGNKNLSTFYEKEYHNITLELKKMREQCLITYSSTIDLLEVKKANYRHFTTGNIKTSTFLTIGGYARRLNNKYFDTIVKQRQSTPTTPIASKL